MERAIDLGVLNPAGGITQTCGLSMDVVGMANSYALHVDESLCSTRKGGP